MRILVAHSFYRVSGGEDRYVREQVELLRDNHEVALLSRSNEELEPSPVLALRMTFSPSEYAAVSRTIRRFQPDVIHLHNAYPSLGPAVHLAARRHGIPIVMTVHNFRLRCPNGLMFTEGSACQRCVGGAYWNAVVHECFPTRSQASAYAVALSAHRLWFRLEDVVDCFIAPSQFMADRLMSWGIPSDRITIVRNFTASHPPTTPPGRNGLYLGRLSAEKGVDVLLDGLARAGNPPFEIAGSGPAGNDLRRRAAELGLTNVTFLGQLDSKGVVDALRRARYVAVPSAWDEPLGLVALEALAAGRPVIGTATGGLKEIVDKGGGIVTPPGDADALAAAIRRYVDDDELVAAAGERARTFAASEFTPHRHLAALEQLYANVVGHGARSRPLPILATDRGAGAPGAPNTTPRPLKVLMVHCYYRDLGGENLSFEAEVRLLRSRGHEVVVYSRDNREIDTLDPLKKGRVALRTVWADDAYGDLQALVRRERPDLVHFQNTFPLISPSAFHAVSRLGVPVVVALRNFRLVCASGILWRDGGPCEDCVGRRVGTPGIQHACYHDSAVQSAVVVTMQAAHRALGTWTQAVDAYVVPSAFAAEKFAEAGLPRDRLHVKGNFVDPDPGANHEPGNIAVFAGRLAPEKGVATLLEAWRRVPGMRLVLIGDGPFRPEVEETIRRHSLGGRVSVLGYQPPHAVMAALGTARFAVFPSEWYETFGRTAIEAFACGVPVLASDLGSVAELVDDGVNGFLFPSGDSAGLAERANRLAADPALAVSLGRAARRRFETDFTAARNYEQLIEIYRSALAGVPSAGVLAV